MERNLAGSGNLAAARPSTRNEDGAPMMAQRRWPPDSRFFVKRQLRSEVMLPVVVCLWTWAAVAMSLLQVHLRQSQRD